MPVEEQSGVGRRKRWPVDDDQAATMPLSQIDGSVFALALQAPARIGLPLPGVAGQEGDHDIGAVRVKGHPRPVV